MLHSTVAFLRRWYSFIEKTGRRSPNHVKTRLFSLGHFVACYRANRKGVCNFLVPKEKDISEDAGWWLLTQMVDTHFDKVCRTMREVQGNIVLLCEQEEYFDVLYEDVFDMYLVS